MAKSKTKQNTTETAHVVTQEDLDNNPELVEKGIKVGDEIFIPVPPETAPEEVDASMRPYFEAYPNVDTFYKTSDGQVFFEKNLAELNRTALKDTNPLQTFKRK